MKIYSELQPSYLLTFISLSLFIYCTYLTFAQVFEFEYSGLLGYIYTDWDNIYILILYTATDKVYILLLLWNSLSGVWWYQMISTDHQVLSLQNQSSSVIAP